MFILSFNLQTFSQQIDENGFTIFVSGILLTLSLYHFMLYFQHKDKAYLYYALYTILVLMHSYYRVDSFFIKDTLAPITPYVLFLHASVKWAYATIYLLFSLSFIDLNKYHPKWNTFLQKIIRISLSFLVLTSLLSIVLKDQRISEYVFNFVFFPSLLVLSIFALYLFGKTKSSVKYYLIIGFSVFFISSILTQTLAFMNLSYRIIFYLGVVFEATLFALGLGAKQRNILKAKNEAQRNVIIEHDSNIKLQEQIQQKLDKEVSEKTREILAITNKTEKEQREKMALDYSKRTLDLRMRALQTQMNPHFLFNSLNSIKHFIIRNKTEDASFFLSKLSLLIRRILDNSKLKEISLKQELHIMRLYLDVENMRLDQKIELEINIEDRIDLETQYLPPMVLQPFIENAIWHGLALKKGTKRVQITIIEKEELLQICIEDNGIGRERAAVLKDSKFIQKKSLGISLTKQRLDAYIESKSQNNVSIVFHDLYDDDEPIGTNVCIKIPTGNLSNPIKTDYL